MEIGGTCIGLGGWTPLLIVNQTILKHRIPYAQLQSSKLSTPSYKCMSNASTAFLPGPRLGALLSSYLEGALYKFHR